jgi:hypothetical protein
MSAARVRGISLLLRMFVLAAFIGVSGMAGTAGASRMPITITDDYSAQIPGLVFFHATGPLCTSGTFFANWQTDTLGSVRAPVIDVFSGHVNSTAWDHIPTGRWWGTDTYMCDDGTGSFVLEWLGVGRVFEGSGVFGTFRITSGTGAYSGIRAHGSFWYIIYPAGGPHLELTGSLN